MRKGGFIAVVCCVVAGMAGFFLGRSRPQPGLAATTTNATDDAVLSVAAHMAVTKAWLSLVEGGDTNRAKDAMMSYLVTQEMILTGLFDEYPHGTNVAPASNVLLRTRQFLDQRVTGDQKMALEARWGIHKAGDQKP